MSNTSAINGNIEIVPIPFVGLIPVEKITATEAVAIKYNGKAQKEAWNAQIRRVSRRLLLSVRAEKLTCVCADTGIVSLLEIPAIPGFAAEYTHPLSSLGNARGIAQRGMDYLRKLESQTLAGILIVLASSYDLFRFQPSDSGAQKNAILRTAGKDLLIDAIILIEDNIHSRNAQFLPRLSLVADVVAEAGSFDKRLYNYLQLLSEAITKPDTERYDENAPPKKIGRPVYIKEVEEKERKLSYLARQEFAAAKKQLEADAKTAKTLASNLVSLELAKAVLKTIIRDVFANKGMALLSTDKEAVDTKLIPKLLLIEHSDARELIILLRKDRSILKKEITEEDDPVPGNEPSILDEIGEVDTPSSTDSNSDTDSSDSIDSTDEEKEEEKEPQPPEGLSFIEKILWKKKYAASKAPRLVKPYIGAIVESTHVYIPTEEKKKLGGS